MLHLYFLAPAGSWDTLANPGFSCGAKVERLRREVRGAIGAEGGGVWGGGVPLLNGKGSGRGNFLDFCLGMVYYACILTHD